MKKILCFALIALLLAGAIGVANAAERGRKQSPGVGNIVTSGSYDWEPGKTFRLVRYVQRDVYSENISDYITADSIVIWSTLSPDGVTVTTTIVTSDSRVAGVMAVNTPEQITAGNTAQQDYAQQNWGWLQTHGLAQVRTDTSISIGSILSGDALGTGSVAGLADAFQIVADIPNTARYTGGAAGEDPALTDSNAMHAGNAGFYMNSATATQDVAVFLKCE